MLFKIYNTNLLQKCLVSVRTRKNAVRDDKSDVITLFYTCHQILYYTPP